jgi:hypothetical protein
MFADADGADDQDVLGVLDKAHRDELAPGGLVVGHLCSVVPRLEDHGRIQVGGAGAHAGGGGVTALHLVGEQLLQELQVAQVVLTGEGDSLGQGVEQLAEAQPAHE